MEPPLSPEAVRVLGALLEKELSTPEYYPLSLNALLTACNQKSNRDPVVAYDEATVLAALDELQRRRLVGRATGGRTTKYRHTLAEVWHLSDAGRAALAVLLLRGPQTVGEVRARTGRMHDFADLEAVAATLEALAAHEPPLVAQLPRPPGRKEARFAHLLGGPPAPPPPAGEAPPDRIDALEVEVATLRARLDALEAAFEAFRSQFE